MKVNPWQSTQYGTTDYPIPPVRTRRQTLTRGRFVLAGLAVVSYGPSIPELVRHQAPADTAMGFAVFGGLLIAVLPILFCHSLWPARRGTGPHAHLLTAKTATGWRTIDLTQIRTIRYRSLSQYRHTRDYVTVRDANRVRLGINMHDQLAVGWLRDATLNSHEIRISAKASTALGLDAADPRKNPTCWNSYPVLYGLLLWVALFTAYVASADAFVRQ